MNVLQYITKMKNGELKKQQEEKRVKSNVEKYAERNNKPLETSSRKARNTWQPQTTETTNPLEE